MKIIAFTGMPFSGKSEAVQVAKDKGIPVVRMGDMVWEETRKQGKELTDKNVGAVASMMREKQGNDIWARRTGEAMKKLLSNTECVVVDGIRNIEEITWFKKNLGADFHLVAVEASDQIREKRALQRGRQDDSATLAGFKERDKRELHWGLGGVIASADVVIPNDGSVAEFRKKISRLLQDFVKR